VTGGERRGFELDQVVLRSGDDRQLDILSCLRCAFVLRGSGLALEELLLPGGEHPLAALYRSALELHCSELFAARSEVFLRRGKRGLALGQLPKVVRELGLASLELGGAKAQHALDGGARVAKELLAPLELLDGFAQTLCVSVELAPPLGEHGLQSLLGIGALCEHALHEAASARLHCSVGFGVRHRFGWTVVLDAGESILSRRVWSDPPASRDFADAETSPPGDVVPGRLKPAGYETDTRLMDTQGARLLAARLRAGVAIGARIELVEAPADDSGLCAGDRGIVDGIDEDGRVVVSWDRGFASEIDPNATPITTLAA